MKKLLFIFALLAFTPCTSFAAVATVQNWVSGTALSKAYLSNNTAHDLLVACVDVIGANATIDTVTDTAGNTWTKALGPIRGGTALQNSVWTIWYVADSKAGANTVSFTNTGGSQPGLFIAEYSGADTTSPLDGTNSATSSTSTTNPATGNIVTTAAGVVIGCFTDTGGFGTAGTGFTQEKTQATNWYDTIIDQITSAAGTYNPNITITSAPYAAVGIAFKQAAGGGGTTHSDDSFWFMWLWNFLFD